jgi:hypothetical protein
MFKQEKFIDQVFQQCCAQNQQGEFNAQKIIEGVIPEEEVKEYWAQKNTTNALNVLEKMRLISGRIEPEYTERHRFLKEVRYGRITKFGNFLKHLPKVARLAWFRLYIVRNDFIAILVILSFITLTVRAFQAIGLIWGAVEYGCVVLLIFILAFLISRLFD